MAGYEDYTGDALEIEREIARKGIALGIDWTDEAQVRLLAHEAVHHLHDGLKQAATDPDDHRLRTRMELFGLAALMLKTMQESAEVGFETHGGPVWKTFARALWAEAAAGGHAPPT